MVTFWLGSYTAMDTASLICLKLCKFACILLRALIFSSLVKGMLAVGSGFFDCLLLPGGDL